MSGAQSPNLRALVRRALKCGNISGFRDWRQLPPEDWTRAERVMGFIEHYLRVPEGALVGKPLKLMDFQQALIYSIYDNPAVTREAYLSISRKNGKTALIAALLLAHIVGPEAQLNSQIVSGALSRDQAALVFNLAVKMINLSPEIREVVRIVPSSKQIVGLRANVEYRALSADASTAHGLSPILAILDEIGQIKGPSSPFIDAIVTAQGAHTAPLRITISTSAPSDADLFSIWCDDAERSQDPKIASFVYTADDGCALDDREQWANANPALGVFRSLEDLEEGMKKAARMPTSEASYRNLFLNQRVALEHLYIAPSVWKENGGAALIEVFRDHSLRQGGIALGLDLSQRQDLTAAVLAAMDHENVVHLISHTFTPLDTLEARAQRDRAPYDTWYRKGQLIALPGQSLDYAMIIEWLRGWLDDNDVRIDSIEFDRWNIKNFRVAAKEQSFGPRSDKSWHEVGQGYRDFSPRCNSFTNLLLQGRLRHGNDPLLTMGAANAVAVMDPAGSVKIDKSKSTQRIDPLVAAIMAAYAVTEGKTQYKSMFSDPNRKMVM